MLQPLYIMDRRITAVFILQIFMEKSYKKKQKKLYRFHKNKKMKQVPLLSECFSQYKSRNSF